ncbi:MAG: ACP S-malonyltransferase [Clostridiales Family XIII bacterium]|jgi:[acyl-carrier-protein] S-malonyltransferase|nr:ACP S-malonyltransferase [Clostridiales Family XIII bacterium]
MVRGPQKRIAAVFAGQGAQYPGMGRSLYETSAAARSVFEAAGEKVMRDCFEASREELDVTDVTQPAVYTVDMAAWAAFAERLGLAWPGGALRTEPAMCGVEIVGMAGFSLGEYAAFTAAGVIPGVERGIELIKERGRLMALAGRHSDGSPRGAMAAVLGAREDIMELVQKARGPWVLEAVNLNAPTQTAIAGDAEAIEAFAALAKGSGRKLRVMPLPVSTAFHSPIMAPASDGIREAASQMEFGEPEYELYLDMTAGTLAEYMREMAPGAGIAEAVPEIMAGQVRSPVRWQEVTEALAASGADVIVEFGPGKTLTGLAKKTVPGLTAVNVEDAETLEKAISAVCGPTNR